MSESVEYIFVDGEYQPDYKVGFNKAVELTGKSRSTIDRDTKSGKLPSEGGPGARKYKVSDLMTTYGLVEPKEPVPETPVPESSVMLVAGLLLGHFVSQQEYVRLLECRIQELGIHNRLLQNRIDHEPKALPAPTPWWKKWLR